MYKHKKLCVVLDIIREFVKKVHLICKLIDTFSHFEKKERKLVVITF